MHHPKLVVVGLAPGTSEEEEGRVFAGPSGVIVRKALERAGLNLETDVSLTNLIRCRDKTGGFDGDVWKKAAQKCRAFLANDLPPPHTTPLLLLGSQVVERFLGGITSIRRERGMWRLSSCGNYEVFSAYHPAYWLRKRDTNEQREGLLQFINDVQRCVNRVLLGPPRPLVPRNNIKIYHSVGEAKGVLAKLAQSEHPFAFDIETYDANSCPSRKGVAVDACHPDFRVRGVAISNGKVGYWIDFTLWEGRARAEARQILDPVFGNAALKMCQNGAFDEDGLVCQGWVSNVKNRMADSMLAMIALGDTINPPSVALDWGVVNILGENQYWDNTKKEFMRELPIEKVALGAVNDAAATYRLCEVLHERLKRGEYL